MSVDIHHHIVYSVDDGAVDYAMSMKMLHIAAEQRVTDIVCTSHTMPGRRDLQADTYERHLEELRNGISQMGIGIRLHTGSEILYTSEMFRALKRNPYLRLGHSWNILLEFRPDTTYQVMRQCIADTVNSGYGVVLAHVERYGCLRERDHLEELKDEFEIWAQMNAATVLKTNGLFCKESWAKKMLRNRSIDVVASDAHNTTDRSCIMREARTYLKNTYGREYARKLCLEAPAEILGMRIATKQSR